MTQTIYYVEMDRERYGPFSLETLRNIHLTPDIPVASGPLGSDCDSLVWMPAVEYDELIGSLWADNSGSVDTEVSESPNVPTNAPLSSACIDSISQILDSINTLTSKDDHPYKLVFESRHERMKYHIGEYNRIFRELLDKISRLIQINNIEEIPENILDIIVSSVNNAIIAFDTRFDHEFSVNGSTQPRTFTSIVQYGRSTMSFGHPFGDIKLHRREFVDAMGSGPLLLTYDEKSKEIAETFADTLTGVLFRDNAPRSLRVVVFDMEDMSGLDTAFNTLDRELYDVISDTEAVRDKIRDLHRHISDIIRNLLIKPDMTLREYNAGRSSAEPFILVVVKSFPSGLQQDALNMLRLIAKNGPRAGVGMLVLTSDNGRNRHISPEEFFNIPAVFNFENAGKSLFGSICEDHHSEGPFRIAESLHPTLHHNELIEIVKSVSNSRSDENDRIMMSDYLPDRNNWWKGESCYGIDIPFGLSPERNSVALHITQESGQNTAVVIGIPGSGKSVFLHSLILNAAFKYSPDELRMYLIDFSGVEFNAYAIANLPHARVIAPEAEREFGLSILRELEEEGARRMELCRQYNANSIVELRRIDPTLNVPRLLVVIDEFQKLFDETNDKSSQEANAKIHTIIQEFRKFGINLILATQKLPPSSMLPRDLIANRVVFKCTPNDFQSLITMENPRETPRLRTGECIYNSESGASYDNRLAKGFFATKDDIDGMLDSLSRFAENNTYRHEPVIVFRSDELPEFETRRTLPEHILPASAPQVVPIYLGESIAVNQVDVCISLVKENGNNILVAGGEALVAGRIALHAILSAVNAHEPDSATVVALNGMRIDNPLWPEADRHLSASRINYSAPRTQTEVASILADIKEEVDLRRNNPEAVQPHIYIAGFDVQGIRTFDPDSSGIVPKPSAAARHMAYILANGPAVGVFTILQADTLAAAVRIDPKVLDMCNYRIALQMPEGASMKIMDSYAANRLFVLNRPSSRFRAYMRDNRRNISIKFKPYK